MRCAFEVVLPELHEENLAFQAELESLKSADDEILALEAQVIAFKGEAEQYDSLEEELISVKAEVALVQSGMTAVQADLEKAALANQVS